MRIRLDRISEGLDLDEPVTQQWLRESLGPESPYQPTDDGRLQVHLMRADEVVHVRGTATMALESQCSRCLSSVKVMVKAPLEVAMFPAGHEPPAGTDGELNEDDMGVATYEDQKVDLSSVVHDAVFLELPMNPRCREDCVGLCSQCGADLNKGPCGCEPQYDPRFTALRSIKLN